MRLMLIVMMLCSGCAWVSVNKPGVAVNGLMTEQGARRQFSANTVDDGAARGDCVSQYTADGTLITSDVDGVSANCYGGGDGYSGSGRDGMQSRLDNPDFAPAPNAEADEELAARARLIKAKEAKLKAQEAKNKADEEKLKKASEAIDAEAEKP
jgi:hypothetical protein